MLLDFGTNLEQIYEQIMWLTEVGKRQLCFPKKMIISLSVILNIHHMISLGIIVYESRTKSKLTFN